jgi:hypothetical protein
MASDAHPADDLARAVQGLFNGDNLKQAIRDAWDRHFGPKPVDADSSDTVKQMNKAAMDKAAQDAAKSFITPDAAASIRAKSSGMLKGGK